MLLCVHHVLLLLDRRLHFNAAAKVATRAGLARTRQAATAASMVLSRCAGKAALVTGSSTGCRLIATRGAVDAAMRTTGAQESVPARAICTFRTDLARCLAKLVLVLTNWTISAAAGARLGGELALATFCARTSITCGGFVPARRA